MFAAHFLRNPSILTCAVSSWSDDAYDPRWMVEVLHEGLDFVRSLNEGNAQPRQLRFSVVDRDTPTVHHVVSGL
jgi:hypothetical protein